ncbi:MAG: NAD(+) kinase [Thermoplasmata archaeon]|nr:MAG: NAD(+) kinase [Thermoplasmatales archaeon ex4484_6]RLF61404.1 MAG: NAD(+) kinase [Thermoplasmata archaeon]RLF69193.1 MAG: NAD(+) kinase [Thermoplasmata archaeon]
MKMGIVAHKRKKLASEIARNLISYLEKKKEEGEDIEIVLDEFIFNSMGIDGLESQPVNEMKVDFIICIGGDGTILRTLQVSEAPVLGINAGSLGFLTEVPPENMKNAIDQMISGNYTIEKRSRIKTMLNDERLPDATNEAVVATSTPSKIQDFELYIDMEWAQRIRADGIIISTPTGSTSYALSAGGSVIDPRLEAMEIVPIAPFRINSRPFIIPDTAVINLKIAHRTRTANLVLDGFIRRTIRNKDELLFTRSKTYSHFIRFDVSFYRKLQEKIILERPNVNKKGKY